MRYAIAAMPVTNMVMWWKVRFSVSYDMDMTKKASVDVNRIMNPMARGRIMVGRLVACAASTRPPAIC